MSVYEGYIFFFLNVVERLYRSKSVDKIEYAGIQMPRDDELRTTIPVKDIMSTPVVTVSKDDTVESAGKTHGGTRPREHRSRRWEEPPGRIITERDIVVESLRRICCPAMSGRFHHVGSP